MSFFLANRFFILLDVSFVLSVLKLINKSLRSVSKILGLLAIIVLNFS